MLDDKSCQSERQAFGSQVSEKRPHFGSQVSAETLGHGNQVSFFPLSLGSQVSEKRCSFGSQVSEKRREAETTQLRQSGVGKTTAPPPGAAVSPRVYGCRSAVRCRFVLLATGFSSVASSAMDCRNAAGTCNST